MDEPNLQTVPKPYTYYAVATPPLTDGSGTLSGNHRLHTINMRRAFVAPPGCLLLSADYRQLEFRLMAHFRSVPFAMHPNMQHPINTLKWYYC